MASKDQMGRFETEFLATDRNLAALADLSGRWIDRMHERHPSKTIMLDMGSSVSLKYNRNSVIGCCGSQSDSDAAHRRNARP